MAGTEARRYGFTGWKPEPLNSPKTRPFLIKGEGDIRKMVGLAHPTFSEDSGHGGPPHQAGTPALPLFNYRLAPTGRLPHQKRRKPKTENRKLETGNSKLETRNSKLETRNFLSGGLDFFG